MDNEVLICASICHLNISHNKNPFASPGNNYRKKKTPTPHPKYPKVDYFVSFKPLRKKEIDPSCRLKRKRKGNMQPVSHPSLTHRTPHIMPLEQEHCVASNTRRLVDDPRTSPNLSAGVFCRQLRRALPCDTVS